MKTLINNADINTPRQVRLVAPDTTNTVLVRVDMPFWDMVWVITKFCIALTISLATQAGIVFLCYLVFNAAIMRIYGY